MRCSRLSCGTCAACDQASASRCTAPRLRNLACRLALLCVTHSQRCGGSALAHRLPVRGFRAAPFATGPPGCSPDAYIRTDKNAVPSFLMVWRGFGTRLVGAACPGVTAHALAHSLRRCEGERSCWRFARDASIVHGSAADDLAAALQQYASAEQTRKNAGNNSQGAIYKCYVRFSPPAAWRQCLLAPQVQPCLCMHLQVTRAQLEGQGFAAPSRTRAGVHGAAVRVDPALICAGYVLHWPKVRRVHPVSGTGARKLQA